VHRQFKFHLTSHRFLTFVRVFLPHFYLISASFLTFLPSCLHVLYIYFCPFLSPSFLSIFLHFFPSIFLPVFILPSFLPPLLSGVPLFHHCSSFYPSPFVTFCPGLYPVYAIALCIIQGVSDVLIDLLTNRQLLTQSNSRIKTLHYPP